MTRRKMRLPLVEMSTINEKNYSVRTRYAGNPPWYSETHDIECDLICGNPECNEVIIEGLDYDGTEKALVSDRPMIEVCTCGSANSIPCKIRAK